MLQRHALDVFGFLVLADFSAAQDVPAVVRGYFIQPGGERPCCVVLGQLAFQFHENFHRGVFRVLPRGPGPAAEAEDRRSIFPVKLAPSVRVARPGTGNRLRRLGYSRRAHPAWSLRFHSLVRTKACKYYILQTACDSFPRYEPIHCMALKAESRGPPGPPSNIASSGVFHRLRVREASVGVCFPKARALSALGSARRLEHLPMLILRFYLLTVRSLPRGHHSTRNLPVSIRACRAPRDERLTLHRSSFDTTCTPGSLSLEGSSFPCAGVLLDGRENLLPDSWCVGRARRIPLGCRKLDGDGGAMRVEVLGVDSAVVLFHRAVAHAQAQAGALPHGLGGIERIEDAVEVAEARAGIAEAHHDFLGLEVSFHQDFLFRCLFDRLRGVGEKIHKDHFELAFINGNARQIGRKVQLKTDARLLSLILAEHQRIADHRCDVQGFAAVLKRAGK